jgi:LCP family protein required for cell wall assembly
MASQLRHPAPRARPTGRRPRRRHSTAERILKGSVIVAAVLLVLAGAAYGYLRYRFGQIRVEHCADCTAVAASAPFNVLLVGGDTRQGVTGAVGRSVGGTPQLEGQADSVKILHVDPAAGTASILSMSYDTYVSLSAMPSGTGIATDNKITAAFDAGINPLVQTIENTFGIPISHFVAINFSGLTNVVNSVGGINLDFRYPVRDNYDGRNMAGLFIPRAGCQTLNGTMALALARSRFYQYEVSSGVWKSDPTGDLGRIQRQDAIIEAVINKAKSSFNPLTINSFLGSLVHDVTIDDGMSISMMISLAQRYHAFSGSSLVSYTLPTYAAYSPVVGDVEVVQEPQAEQVITRFLGGQPGPVTTPPLDASGSPEAVPPVSAPSATQPGAGAAVTGGPTPAPAVTGVGPFNPVPC